MKEKDIFSLMKKYRIYWYKFMVKGFEVDIITPRFYYFFKLRKLKKHIEKIKPVHVVFNFYKIFN